MGITRNEFLKVSTAMMAAGGSHFAATAADETKPAPHSSPRNRHPYKGIDWATAHQIRGTTHVHCKTQADLDVILKRIEFLTLSNHFGSGEELFTQPYMFV